MNIQLTYNTKIYNLLIEKFSNLNYPTLNYKNLFIGDLIEILYEEFHRNNYRFRKIEGVIIAKQLQNFNKSFTIRRFVEGIGFDQIFIYNSPQIMEITKKLSYKVSKNKLYFLRKSLSKSIKLKKKINKMMH